MATILYINFNSAHFSPLLVQFNDKVECWQDGKFARSHIIYCANIVYVYFQETFSFVLPSSSLNFPFIIKNFINYANPELKVIQM